MEVVDSGKSQGVHCMPGDAGALLVCEVIHL